MLLVALLFLFIDYYDSKKTPNRLVMCLATDIGLQSYITISLFFNLGTPLLYVLVGVILKFKINPDQQYNKTIRQIFKAVFVIMILQLVGWLNNQLLQVVMSYLNMDYVSAWLLRNIAAFPLYIALGLDAPALYIFSHEYGKAFIKQFPCTAALFCRKSNGQNTIAPIRVINVQKPISTLQMERINISNRNN
ncbi:hypothetical protein Mgra_00005753 [Meloidogyne graminicola]|uniref:Serpentine receptor class gamma n=1 Tax=Meloidogyne graminicola TaxID=189291 RepID=A0A8S9ZNI8_9BILA|nr:hypothetical protein Mgra_00005753 [Meloidogyne graminicola]